MDIHIIRFGQALGRSAAKKIILFIYLLVEVRAVPMIPSIFSIPFLWQ